MKKQLLILGLLLTFLIAQGSAVTTIGGLSPQDGTYTSDQTDLEFCATPITTESAVNISYLVIGGVLHGTLTYEADSLTNNTEFCITANATLPYGAHTWNFNVSAQDDENISTTYTLNVARLGQTKSLIEELAAGPIPASVVLVIKVVIVVIIFIIIGFITGLFGTIFGGVNSKIKGKVK